MFRGGRDSGSPFGRQNELNLSLWTAVSHFATKQHFIPISQTLQSTIFAYRVGVQRETFTLG